MRQENLVIGYHGCDARLASQLINKKGILPFSRKSFEWLGHGMYFWENNLERAREWAKLKHMHGRIDQPAVIGAILDLRHCCDLTDKNYLDIYQSYYELLKVEYETDKMKLPVNYAPPGSNPKDNVCRRLDCSVIEYMHQAMRKLSQCGTSGTKPFDSVRGVFVEGPPVFEGSDIYRDTHIQLCIRNPECILGFFLPRDGEMEESDAFEVQEAPAFLRWN